VINLGSEFAIHRPSEHDPILHSKGTRLTLKLADIICISGTNDEDLGISQVRPYSGERLDRIIDSLLRSKPAHVSDNGAGT